MINRKKKKLGKRKEGGQEGKEKEVSDRHEAKEKEK